MNLYKKGAGLGQVMAFLIASPWNSFSLTFILISLIGLGYTLLFIVASMLIAVLSGYIFLLLVKNKTLPANPNTLTLDNDFAFFKNLKQDIKLSKLSLSFLGDVLLNGFKDSKIVIKWLFFGIVLASTLRLFLDKANYMEYFGSTALGVAVTLIAATILEVCSEGSTPIAADIVNKAQSPGNGFLFLMTGVSTDYTEIMSLKETTKSWKISFFLPLITLPQILIITWLINSLA